jgi:hypothetical protein
LSPWPADLTCRVKGFANATGKSLALRLLCCDLVLT